MRCPSNGLGLTAQPAAQRILSPIWGSYLILLRVTKPYLPTFQPSKQSTSGLVQARNPLIFPSSRNSNMQNPATSRPGTVSLAALDKQISRLRDDAKLVPERAARLDWRSLARLNYSQTERQRAGAEVEHLIYVREEIVRQIDSAASRWSQIGISHARWLMLWRMPTPQSNGHERDRSNHARTKIRTLPNQRA